MEELVMRKYIALTQNQKQAVKMLGGFFDGNVKTEEKEQTKDDNSPSGYVRVTEVLTNDQKKEINLQEEKIEEGFKKHSAY